MADVTVVGIDELYKKLGAVVATKTITPPMERAVKRVQDGMSKYPPERPGQTYRRGQDPRSEDLGPSWKGKIFRKARGLIGKIGNNASYAPWVQSERFQAWMHRGRWQTDFDVIERNRKKILADFKRAIDEALK